MRTSRGHGSRHRGGEKGRQTKEVRFEKNVTGYGTFKLRVAETRTCGHCSQQHQHEVYLEGINHTIACCATEAGFNWAYRELINHLRDQSRHRPAKAKEGRAQLSARG